LWLTSESREKLKPDTYAYDQLQPSGQVPSVLARTFDVAGAIGDGAIPERRGGGKTHEAEARNYLRVGHINFENYFYTVCIGTSACAAEWVRSNFKRPRYLVPH
jgi:hypothetical protein